MNRYRRLTLGERYQIAGFLNSRISIREIARILRKAPSSISREIRRNCSEKVYLPDKAEWKFKERRRHAGPRPKLSGELLEYVREKLFLEWSPEQIKGRLLFEQEKKISHETIYQFIYKNRKRETLWHHLRRRRPERRPHSRSKKTFSIGVRVSRKWINERPREVELRNRLGDIERDTIEGKRSSSLLLTSVDRLSRLTKIRWIERKNAVLIHEATLDMLRDQKLKTITNDNGAEFGMHELTEKYLKTPIYFSLPYSSWQRGTVENMNGLLRQYFPKGKEITPHRVSEAEDRLNNRPRKCLGYKTPNEVHRELSRCCTEI